MFSAEIENEKLKITSKDDKIWLVKCIFGIFGFKDTKFDVYS